MPPSWDRTRQDALDAITALRDLLLDPDADDRRLIAGYVEAKGALASAFEAFAVSRHGDVEIMRDHKRRIEERMTREFAAVPRKYLRVRGYGDTHARLLAYLVHHQNQEVPAAELRLLTRDAVHTERRTRELRDLGFKLDALHTSGRDVYVLRDANPDISTAARELVRRNILADRDLSGAHATELLHEAGLG